MDSLLYLAPILVIVPRGLLCFRFQNYMSEQLSDAERDTSDHRSLIVALAGFSFAALLGLVALPGSLNDRALPIWYVLLSFLSYVTTLNLQGYKHFRWHDQVGNTLLEMALLGLILSILSFVLQSELPLFFRCTALTLGIATWGIDYWVRVTNDEQFLRAKEKSNAV